MTIANKFPKIEQIAAVYAVIVMLVYPWTLTRYFWKMSSWVLYSSMGDLTIYFAYMMALNFLESLIILVAPLALSVILPRAWFYDRFVSRSVSLVLLGLGYLIFLNRNMYADDSFPWQLVRLMPFVLVAVLALVYLLDRVPFIRRLWEELANRALVFLYISVPLSLISVLIVLVRNIA